MSSRARLATFVIAIVILTGGAINQSFDTAASGIAVGAGATRSVSPHVDPGTTATASPTSTSWSNTSTITVSTLSMGAVSYAVDPTSTDPAGCVIGNPSNTSATISATEVDNCIIDVNVAGDGTYDPSTADPEPEIDFTAAAATTSAVAAPASTPWSSTSAIDVSTNSTGSVTYTVDPSSTLTGCAVNASGIVSATGTGTCEIDVTVAGDANYLASNAQATVTFTSAAATTSAAADPTSTPWSSTSAIDVTTNSTGAVTYTVDVSSTAGGCSVNPSGTVSATGTGTCEIDVSVAGDANYLASNAQATVTFTAPIGGGGGGGSGPTTITQTSATTATVATAASGTFTAGPIAVQGNSGTVTFIVTKPSSSLTVSSAGLIGTTGMLAGGTYNVSGTDSDAHGDTGTWTFSLKVTATVTFSANGGVGTMPAESASAPSTLTLNAFVRKGYTFVGWNTSATGTGVSYANGAQFPFTASTVLFARWKQGALPFKTITFDANGGSGRTASEVENAPAAIEANHFTRRGYVFVAWNTTSQGRGQSFKPGNTYSFKNSITLFARWKKVVSKPPTKPKPPKPQPRIVTFLANGGTGKMVVETRRSPTALTSNGFRRAGYTFTGWNTMPDGKGVAYPNSGTYPFKSSIKLYAQWKKNTPVPLPIAGGIVLGPFATGSTTLTPEMETQIQSLASEAKAQGANKIILYGCGDEVGSTSAANVELARTRAGVVAAYLEPRLSDVGLKGWTISITSTSPSPSEVGSVVATLG